CYRRSRNGSLVVRFALHCFAAGLGPRGSADDAMARSAQAHRAPGRSRAPAGHRLLHLTIDVAGHAVFLPALALAALGVGFVAGMFGIGGGFILTPLLTIAFGIPAPIAVGSSLCQKIGTSAGSLMKYRQYRYGEPRMDWIMMGGSLMGAHAGTAALRALDRRGLVMLFGHKVALVNLAIELVYVAMLIAT